MNPPTQDAIEGTSPATFGASLSLATLATAAPYIDRSAGNVAAGTAQAIALGMPPPPPLAADRSGQVPGYHGNQGGGSMGGQYQGGMGNQSQQRMLDDYGRMQQQHAPVQPMPPAQRNRQTVPTSYASVSANGGGGGDDGGGTRFRCLARGRPEAHAGATIFVPNGATHRQPLACSCPENCAFGRFVWCMYCKVPTATRNFSRRHGDIDSEAHMGARFSETSASRASTAAAYARASQGGAQAQAAQVAKGPPAQHQWGADAGAVDQWQGKNHQQHRHAFDSAAGPAGGQQQGLYHGQPMMSAMRAPPKQQSFATGMHPPSNFQGAPGYRPAGHQLSQQGQSLPPSQMHGGGGGAGLDGGGASASAGSFFGFSGGAGRLSSANMVANASALRQGAPLPDGVAKPSPVLFQLQESMVAAGKRRRESETDEGPAHSKAKGISLDQAVAAGSGEPLSSQCPLSTAAVQATRTLTNALINSGASVEVMAATAMLQDILRRLSSVETEVDGLRDLIHLIVHQITALSGEAVLPNVAAMAAAVGVGFDQVGVDTGGPSKSAAEASEPALDSEQSGPAAAEAGDEASARPEGGEKDDLAAAVMTT